MPATTDPRPVPNSSSAENVAMAGPGEEPVRSRVYAAKAGKTKACPIPHTIAYDNKHGKGLGKDQNDHRDDRSGEARQDHPVSAMKIEYPPAQSTARNNHDGKGAEEEPRVGHPMA